MRSTKQLSLHCVDRQSGNEDKIGKMLCLADHVRSMLLGDNVSMDHCREERIQIVSMLQKNMSAPQVTSSPRHLRTASLHLLKHWALWWKYPAPKEETEHLQLSWSSTLAARHSPRAVAQADFR